MKISTKGRYGLRAMVDIGFHGAVKCVSLKSIAHRQGISEHYLEQLIALLKKAGYVKSVRGAQGGYLLNIQPAQVSVGEILRALEEKLSPVACLQVHEPDLCGVGSCKNCVAKPVWERMYESVNDTLDSISLEELLAGTTSAPTEGDKNG